jgi:pimeloyl-ACP methyl ester carboxylesterase
MPWKTVMFAGHRLRYAVTGRGRAVVLLKKDRGSYASFERLSDRYTMLQVEPLGFGSSDRPADYPSGGIHQQILAVCDQEGIDEFAVWGFSQAGAMACAVAQATPRARLMVCGGFNVLRGLSDAWVARMNRQGRIPVGSRSFWNWFHRYDWHAELRRMTIPKLVYWGSLDTKHASLKDKHILRGLGVDAVEFPGLDHVRCGLGDPDSPATELVANWLHNHGWLHSHPVHGSRLGPRSSFSTCTGATSTEPDSTRAVDGG